MTILVRVGYKGGKGSGNFEHVGRPGQVGGSGSGTVPAPSATGYSNPPKVIRAQPLTSDEADALDGYKGGYAEGINDILNVFSVSNTPRAKREMKGFNAPGSISKGVVKTMDALMQKGTIAQDTTLYRGVSFSGEKSEYRQPDPFLGSEGKTVDNRGFTSTSTSKQSADIFANVSPSWDKPNEVMRGYILELHVPKGSHAVDASDYAGGNSVVIGVSAGEREIILPRNGKMAIRSITIVPPSEYNEWDQKLAGKHSTKYHVVADWIEGQP